MIQDEVVLINGASSGIGAATAKRLAREGEKGVLGERPNPNSSSWPARFVKPTDRPRITSWT